METDVDIMAWAIGTPAPARALQGPMMDALRKLDFIKVGQVSEAFSNDPRRRRRR